MDAVSTRRHGAGRPWHPSGVETCARAGRWCFSGRAIRALRISTLTCRAVFARHRGRAFASAASAAPSSRADRIHRNAGIRRARSRAFLGTRAAGRTWLRGCRKATLKRGSWHKPCAVVDDDDDARPAAASAPRKLENTWFSPGQHNGSATSLYDTKPLRETLLRLVDFDLLNNGPVRYAAGAVRLSGPRNFG